MTRKLIKDQQLANGELESESFAERLRNAQAAQGDLDLARQQYGYELPEDVIEQIARQQAAARPVLEQYHLLYEASPTLAVARATMQKDMDKVFDVFAAMDLDELGEDSSVPDEYTCPKCKYSWSGAPNESQQSGFIFVPTGTVSKRGSLTMKRYGKPNTSVRRYSKPRTGRAMEGI